MPDFSYRAVDSAGKAVRGTVSAVSKGAALDQLGSSGIFATDLAETKAAKASHAQPLPFMPKVSANELVLLTRRLSTLVSADIPLIRCLDTICDRIESPVFRGVMLEVKEDVRHGQGFSAALAKHPDVFPELMINMVRVGETGGILSSVLDQLSDFMERDREIRGEVRMALAYPAMIVMFAIILIVFLMTTAVPKLAGLFADMGDSLPTPTKILMATSGFISANLLWLGIGFVVVVALMIFMTRFTQYRSIMDRLKLSIPIIGGVMRKTSIARFSRSLGALVHGGVPMMEALDTVKAIMNNQRMDESVDVIQEALRRGESVAQGMSRDEDIFPDMVSSMVAAGEESGKLDAMLFKIAEVYEMETRNAVKVVVGLIAPSLIMCVAMLVLFIAMAMLMPIFQINKMI